MPDTFSYRPYCAAAGELGVVAPDAYADLIAVASDPLADVSVLESVQFVMKDGVVFKPSLGERAP
jgi:imidazolonepropionase-like amidohydrolase